MAIVLAALFALGLAVVGGPLTERAICGRSGHPIMCTTGNPASR
ncbi:hypothetical protein ACTMTJ_37405 [Phytohabitans sp. LJ34]